MRNNLTGEVWSFKQSAAYSKAGFEQVNESISISDILLGFEGLRPGPWLIDLKRVDPTKAYDPDAPLFDPHGLFRDADHSH